MTQPSQAEYWNGSVADHWVTFQNRLDTVFAPLTETALGAAAPSGHVLDIGCGCGATTLALAARAARVLGIDVSQPMAARAASRVAAARAANAEILVADAAHHPFPAGSFDLLFSRFGVMFFPDPEPALAHLYRATKPGGRLFAIAWRGLAENPWFTVPLRAAEHLLAPPAEDADPSAPGPFAFADPARILPLLRRAGWRDIAFAPHDPPLDLGPSAAHAAEMATYIGPLAGRLTQMRATPAFRARVAGTVAETLAAHETGGGVTLAGATWFITARA